MTTEMTVTAAESDWTKPGDYVRINDRRRGGPTYYEVVALDNRRTARMILAPLHMRALLWVRDLFRKT
jgi:hypothetical protein